MNAGRVLGDDGMMVVDEEDDGDIRSVRLAVIRPRLVLCERPGDRAIAAVAAGGVT